MRARSLVLGLVFAGISIPAAITATSFLVPGMRVLPPLAYSMFCLRYPKDCEKTHAEKAAPTTEPVKMTLMRRTQLAAINMRVNDSIIPQPQYQTVSSERWVINPPEGDCNDYVVSKRHQLLAKGWPSRALLMAEVALPSGEHHLVLVVETNEGQVVLDNLNPRVRTVAEAEVDYKWVRMESNDNPNSWITVREEG